MCPYEVVYSSCWIKSPHQLVVLHHHTDNINHIILGGGYICSCLVDECGSSGVQQSHWYLALPKYVVEILVGSEFVVLVCYVSREHV